jgi:mRNA interferase HigB
MGAGLAFLAVVVLPYWEQQSTGPKWDRQAVRIVGRDHLTAFCAKHTDCTGWIQAWVAEVERSKWKTPAELKSRYPSASLLGKNVVIFNVKGVRYRLATRVAFNSGVVFVDWAGTHAEYDRKKF